MNVFEHYVQKHGKPYTVRVKNGKGLLFLEFHPGYVTLRSHQPGVHHDTTVNITRPGWWALLRAVVPLSKKMEGSFDPNRALRRYLADEQLLLDEKRVSRRERDEASRVEAKRRRYEAAKHRGSRR